MATDTDIFKGFMDDLKSLLQDSTDGVNAKMESGWEQVATIETTMDTSQLQAHKAPHLLAAHRRSALTETTTRKRDWIHTIAFLYKTNAGDRTERAKDVGRTAEALLRSIDPDGKQVSDLFSNVRVYDVRDLEAFVGLELNSEEEGDYLLAAANFLQRQELQ